MSELLAFSKTVFTGFFAIMNPIANIPVFLGLVGDQDEEAKKSIVKTASITAFKITGGILIFYVGFEMLMSKKSLIHNPGDSEDDHSMAISP